MNYISQSHPLSNFPFSPQQPFASAIPPACPAVCVYFCDSEYAMKDKFNSDITLYINYVLELKQLEIDYSNPCTLMCLIPPLFCSLSSINDRTIGIVQNRIGCDGISFTPHARHDSA